VRIAVGDTKFSEIQNQAIGHLQYANAFATTLFLKNRSNRFSAATAIVGVIEPIFKIPSSRVLSYFLVFFRQVKEGVA
jgi:hypothetical protein